MEKEKIPTMDEILNFGILCESKKIIPKTNSFIHISPGYALKMINKMEKEFGYCNLEMIDEIDNYTFLKSKISPEFMEESRIHYYNSKCN